VGQNFERHGAVSVEEYRDAGYLPHALVNYLALLGWGPEDGREVLTTDELIAEFDVTRVTPSAATFDRRRLEWMNGEHIRRLSINELVAAVLAVRTWRATEIDSTYASSNARSSLRKSARRHSCKSRNKPRFCFRSGR